MTFEQRLNDAYAVRTDPVVWQNLDVLKGSDLAGMGPRYGAFTQTLNRYLPLPTEFILPRIEIEYRNQLPASMKLAEERYQRDPATAARLAAMHWGYYFSLGGGLSTVDNAPPPARRRNRASSILRMRMINDVIARIVGEQKSGMSLLDFACNWGGMAIDMALRGFGQVTAFDMKEENIARAQALSDYMGVANATFEIQNVYNLPSRYEDGFDVVYNLGLLYHVTDPVRLAQITYRLTRKVAVFDTLAHKEPFSGYIQAFISDEAIKRPGMGEQQIELHPTYRGLIDIIRFAGFKDLVEVAPIIGDNYPAREKEAYYQGLRRTIIAFKQA
jgi:ubiquinone/menaquinone biosynthesis C-methylase UbiE